MPEMKPVPVKSLALDLANFRTVRQADELAAVEAMISTSPDRFWALMDSLLNDGYLPTENIIVLRKGAKLTVKEGNRRIAALKLIHGILPINNLPAPDEIARRISQVPSSWIKNNKSAPCTIYNEVDAAIVDRIVTLAHGKGEKAGRDQWNAVARARHNREANGSSEPALDLLEKYLANGKNLTQSQAARWAGNYPLSVLAEAMKRLAPRLGVKTSPVLAGQYPNVKHRDALESILHDIGQDNLGFDDLRRKDRDFAIGYGIQVSDPKPKPSDGAGGGTTGGAPGAANPGTGASGGGGSKPNVPPKPKAVSINDPRAVRKLLKSFTPRGTNREKVVTLKLEAERLDVARTPIAFCFLLRSMFEISAKAYCKDHASSGLSTMKANGQEKHLADLLRDITKHLTGNNTDKEMTKALHGAIAELASKDSFLSVTSMNQLVHNPKFSVTPSHVSTLFGNIFPLLEAMNS